MKRLNALMLTVLMITALFSGCASSGTYGEIGAGSTLPTFSAGLQIETPTETELTAEEDTNREPHNGEESDASIPTEANDQEIPYVEYDDMQFYPAVEDIENGVWRAPKDVAEASGVDCLVSLDFDGELYYAKSRFLEHSIFLLYTDDSFSGEITLIKHQDKECYNENYEDYYHFGYEQVTVNGIPVQVFGDAMACWEFNGYYYQLSGMGESGIVKGIDLKTLLPFFVGIA